MDRSTETRALLVRAATELLQNVGYRGTTTALIAKRAGLTTGALHHHFATKDELMFGVFDEIGERVKLRFEELEHKGSHGGLDVRRLVRHLWEVYGDPEYWAIWEIIIATRADAAIHRKVVAHRLETMRHVLHPWVREALAREPEPEMLALFELMLIAIRGLRLERFLDKDQAYFERNLDGLAELVGLKLARLGVEVASV